MKARGELLASIVVAFFVITFLVPTAFAEIPPTINYQGKLTDSGGVPIDGTVSMTFAIYNAPTGGDLLWDEIQSSVTVTDGVFSVALGSVTPLTTLDFNEPYFLGVTVGGDAEMTPRAALQTVPYAARAGMADTAYALIDNAVTSAKIQDGTITGTDIADGTITGTDIADSTVADADIDAAIARDSEIMPAVLATDGAGSTLDADLSVALDNPVDFTDLSQGVPTSWSWDFGDTGTSTLQNPSHTYTSDGTYTVSLTAGDGVTSNTATKAGYITVKPPGIIFTVDSAGFVGEYTSIAIGADGLPVVSYLDSTNFDLKVAHCGDAACTPATNTINTVDSAGVVGVYTSIAIGADGLPVVSYWDSTNSDLKVAHCGDASCSTGNIVNTVDSAGTVGIYTSIAIGTDNLPVVSYYDVTNGDLKVLHCGIANCTSDNTITTVDSAGTVGQYTSIAIGADGLPVISYYDSTNLDLKVAHCGDAACSTGNTVTTVDSAGQVGWYPSIAIGTDNLPVVSYWDSTNSDLKVAHCGVANCTSGNTITTVDSAGTVGEYTSIAIGADGLPIVSYRDGTNNGLKAAHCGDADCKPATNTITTVDSAGDVGWYSSIAIGADNLPVISYWDDGLGKDDLKVAKCGDATCLVWP
jgi:PKD repeat protein